MTRPSFNRRRSGPSRRQRPSRSERIPVLIVCEGRETEPNYFDQFKREECVRKRFKIDVKPGKGGSRQQVAQTAVDRARRANVDYDEVWCIMDVESPEGLDDMREAVLLLEAHDMRPVLSNPAFEVWLLAHFERTGTGFLNGGAVVARLNKCWQQQFRRDYDKANEQIYRQLLPLMERAIANAEWVREKHHAPSTHILDCNSATDVYRLVVRLRAASGQGS